MLETRERYYTTILYHAMKENRCRFICSAEQVDSLRLRLASMYIDMGWTSALDQLEDLMKFSDWDPDYSVNLRDFYGYYGVEMHEYTPFEVLLYVICLSIAFSQRAMMSREVNPFCKLDTYIFFSRKMQLPRDEDIDDAIYIFNKFTAAWNAKLEEGRYLSDGDDRYDDAVQDQCRS